MSVPTKLDYISAKPDNRDLIFQLSDLPPLKSSDSASLSVFQLPVGRVESQGAFGSCTSFALTNSFENLVFVVTGDSTYQASALFNYSQSRILDSVSLQEDPGTTLRSAHGNLRISGICRDITWPYRRSNFALVPTNAAYEEAFPLSKTITYFEVKRDLPVMKHILGNLRYFVAVGFRVYPSFQSREVSMTGDIPMPTTEELKNGDIGGHAFCIIGWNDERRVYIVLNNYGMSWGNNGTGTIPYDYFEDENLTTEAKLMIPSDDFLEKYRQSTTTSDTVNMPEYDDQDRHFNYFTIITILLAVLCIVITFFMWWYFATTAKTNGK